MSAVDVNQVVNDLLDEMRARGPGFNNNRVPNGDIVHDLGLAAQQASWKRTEAESHCALIIAELRKHGLSWRQISFETGIPVTTALRWSALL